MGHVENNEVSQKYYTRDIYSTLVCFSGMFYTTLDICFWIGGWGIKVGVHFSCFLTILS